MNVYKIIAYITLTIVQHYVNFLARNIYIGNYHIGLLTYCIPWHKHTSLLTSADITQDLRLAFCNYCIRRPLILMGNI